MASAYLPNGTEMRGLDWEEITNRSYKNWWDNFILIPESHKKIEEIGFGF